MSARDEQITLTPIVRFTGEGDTADVCGACGLPAHRLVGEPQHYILETGEPMCGTCASKIEPGFNLLLHIYIMTKEFIDRTGMFKSAAAFLVEVEKLRPMLERHRERYAPRSEADEDENDERVN